MKILFWTDGFWPRVGGIETQGLKFIEKMVARGHEYVVFAQKDNCQDKDSEIYNGISIKRFDFNSIILRQHLMALRPIEECLQRLLKEFQPDIVHLNACIGLSAFVFLIFKHLFRLPVVLTIHSPFFYGNETNLLIEKIALKADQICCVSNWVLSETEKLIPAARDKLRRIHNGLPLPEAVFSSGPFVIGPSFFRKRIR